MERDAAKSVIKMNQKDFNSHAHVERDSNVIANLIKSLISTHTLTWSVTFPSSSTNATKLYFNSHAHVERDKPPSDHKIV